MKRFLLAPALTFICVFQVLSQTAENKGLVLTGTLIDVNSKFDFKSTIDHLDHDAMRLAVEKEENYIFEVRLYLQFRNESNTPMIIFLPGNFDGQKKLTFVPPSKSDSSTVIAKERSYPKTYDPFPDLLQELTAAEPSKATFVIIEPKGYYECHERLWVRTGYKFDLTNGRKPWNAPSVPEYNASRVVYHLSLKDQKEHSDALRTARQKWKEFGDLPLDSNGDYSVTSEIILNKFTD